jgi:hypothetical protein
MAWLKKGLFLPTKGVFAETIKILKLPMPEGKKQFIYHSARKGQKLLLVRYLANVRRPIPKVTETVMHRISTQLGGDHELVDLDGNAYRAYRYISKTR